MNSTDEQEKQIIDLYYDVWKGLWTNPKQLYEKLDKKIPLKKIKEVLNKIQNKQIKWTKTDEKIFLPITASPNWFQADLTFYCQYKKVNNGYHVIMNIININSKKLYSYLMKNKKTDTIIKNFKQLSA